MSSNVESAPLSTNQTVNEEDYTTSVMDEDDLNLLMNTDSNKADKKLLKPAEMVKYLRRTPNLIAD